MTPTLTKAVLDLLVMGGVGVFAGRAFVRTGAIASLLELIGAAGWAMLGITHLCEALYIFPTMQWGVEGSPGHYLNLTSFAVGLLLPLGFVLARGQRAA